MLSLIVRGLKFEIKRDSLQAPRHGGELALMLRGNAFHGKISTAWTGGGSKGSPLSPM